MPPLAGIRILDCGWIIAGPLATRLLSDFGAEVIKIESPSRPDRARGNRVPLFGHLPGDANANADTGGYFQDVNAGKLSCSLNLANEGGRELLRRLIAVSDAMITNLGGGDQLDRWGVGYEAARGINPRIIVLTLPTMESTGPRARWHSVGDSFNAMSGLKSVSGYPGDPGLQFGHHYPDFSANPCHAAIALMAALHQRHRTGEGQFIEVSQYESTASLLGAAVLQYTANGRVPSPNGNRNPDAAPHNIFRCRGEDSWCAISVHTDAQWQALAATEGLEALRRPELSTLAGRRAHEGEIETIIEAWTSGWDRQELACYLQERGVPAGAYQDIPDIVERDPVMGNRYFVRRQHPGGREFLVHGSPIQARRDPATVKLGPLLGEHTTYVLQEVLGLSADEIAEYAAAGALDCRTSRVAHRRRWRADRARGVRESRRSVMAYEKIIYEPGPVARVILNRPERLNAQSFPLLYEMDHAFRTAVNDPEVRVVVLSGAGRSFSAGHDLDSPEALKDRSEREQSENRFALGERFKQLYVDMHLSWRNLAKPTIAMVHGYCIFGGWMIASAMDIIYASEDALFIPTAGDYYTTGWDVGPRKAKELLFGNRFMSAQEAMERGFVNRVFAAADLEKETMVFANRVAENDSVSLRAIKFHINQTMDMMGFSTSVHAASTSLWGRQFQYREPPEPRDGGTGRSLRGRVGRAVQYLEEDRVRRGSAPD